MGALVLSISVQALNKATNMVGSTGVGAIITRVTQTREHTKHPRQTMQCLLRTQPDLPKHRMRPNRRPASIFVPYLCMQSRKVPSKAVSGGDLAGIYRYTYLRV